MVGVTKYAVFRNKYFLRQNPIPRGSKYPNSRVSGTKNHSEYGFWDLKPYYLGTWTLWD